MSWRVAKCLLVLREEVNSAAAGRGKASDGTIGDASHQAGKSDHNPDADSVVRAMDITHDPDNGCDAGRLANHLRARAKAGDKRLKYLIFNWQIAGSWTNWEWTTYGGENSHKSHVHISVVPGDEADAEDSWEVTAPVISEEAAKEAAAAAKKKLEEAIRKGDARLIVPATTTDSTPWIAPAAPSIVVNSLSLVHQGSRGMSMATLPNVCNIPGPTGPIPVPFTNTAKSSDLAGGSKRVAADGGNSAATKGSNFARSTGDEAGTLGGVASGTFSQKATWLMHAFNVMLEGRPACRLTDKMLMNKGNSVCLGGEVQAPVVSIKAGPEQKPEPQVCATGPVVVSCGHKERTFQLSWPAKSKPSRFVASHIFQVVATPWEADTVRVSTSFKKPPCSNHRRDILSVDSHFLKLKGPTPLSFPVYCDPVYGGTVPRLAHFWPLPAQKLTYVVTPNACNPQRAQPVIIEVFPDIQWAFKFSYGSNLSREHSLPHRRGGQRQTEGGTLEAKYTRGSVTQEVSGDLMKEVQTSLRVLETAQNLTKKMVNTLSKVGAVEIEVQWPHLTISGQWGYEENPKSNAVEFPLDIKLGAHPFFGFEGKADILDYLVLLIPYVGPLVRKIKRAAHKGAGRPGSRFRAQLTIAIWVKVGAKVSGDLYYSHQLGQGTYEAGGRIKGEIPFAIEPEVSGELSYCMVKASAGIKGGGRCGVYVQFKAGMDNEEIFVKGEMGISKAEFYYMAYVKADAKVSEWKPKIGYEREGSYTIWEGTKWEFLDKPLHVFKR